MNKPDNPMQPALSVACVKWGRMYPACYVNALHAIVKRNMPQNHAFAFACFTEDTSGLNPEITVKKLPAGLAGWWNKLALFQPNAFTPGERVVYFDLDTLITGSLEPLLNYQGDFALLRDFYRPDGYGSGVMLWRAGACDALWSSYERAGRPEPEGGDQAWIEQHYAHADIIQELFPGLVASYKVDCRNGPPAEARIIAFHGEPKQDNCGAGWVAACWQAEGCTRDVSGNYAAQLAILRWLLGSGQARQALQFSETFLPHSDDYEALHLFGVCAQMKGETERARMRYEEALTCNPDYAYARLALAQILMQQTHFRDGRDHYEARFDAVTEANGPDWRGLPYKRWQGESLQGKKLYIWAEQGLGDIIMFAGFLPHLLAQSPARIVLGMFPKLMSLFARSFPHIEIESIDQAGMHALAPSMAATFPQIEKLAGHTALPFALEPLRAAYLSAANGLFDVAAPLADMLVYGLPDYVPAHHPAYLKADAIRVSTIRSQLQQHRPGKCVGISWATTNKREAHRNITLEELAPLLSLPEYHFISLQHAVKTEDIARFCEASDCSITVPENMDMLQDADGLVALIAAMDMVVTIDNSIVHLAGALGVKTILLLPKGANFRWPEMEQSKNNWYESVTILQQQEPFDWVKALASLINLLKTS